MADSSSELILTTMDTARIHRVPRGLTPLSYRLNLNNQTLDQLEMRQRTASTMVVRLSSALGPQFSERELSTLNSFIDI